MSLYPPMDHAATLDIQEALREFEAANNTALRTAHEAINQAADKLRQRLQVVCMGGDEPENDSGD